MTDGFLASSVRRLARNYIIAGFLGLAVVAGFLWLEGRYLYNFFHGPFPIDRSVVLSMHDADSRRQYFVSLAGDETFSTGRQEETTDYFITRHYPILALRIGDNLLLVKTSGDTSATSFAGALSAIPSDLNEGVVQPLLAKHPELRGRFLPLMLDATSFRSDGYLGLSFAALLSALWTWMLVSGIRWRATPSSHRVYKKLARFGPAQQMEMHFDAQIRANGGGEKVGSATLTPNWMINQRAFALSLMRTADVVWCYQRIIKHYHGFIPTGKTFSILAYDRDGTMAEIAVKKNTAAAALAALRNRVPNALFGYNEALFRMWRKNRAEFIRQVDARAAQAKAAPSIPQNSTEERKLVHV